MPGCCMQEAAASFIGSSGFTSTIKDQNESYWFIFISVDLVDIHCRSRTTRVCGQFEAPPVHHECYYRHQPPPLLQSLMYYPCQKVAAAMPCQNLSHAAETQAASKSHKKNILQCRCHTKDSNLSFCASTSLRRFVAKHMPSICEERQEKVKQVSK